MDLFKHSYDKIIVTLDSGLPVFYKDKDLDLMFYKRNENYIIHGANDIEASLNLESFKAAIVKLSIDNFSKKNAEDNVIAVDFNTKKIIN